MNNSKAILWLLLCFMVLSIQSDAWPDSAADHRLFDGLLKKYVSHGSVDYKGFKNEEHVLDQYLKILEGIRTRTLNKDDQLAYYINAYNAWTVKLILTGYPDVKSIKDLGGLFSTPWKKRICRIDGTIISLDYLEHEIIRKQFKDPRVHFAINCASKSCPELRAGAYIGGNLGLQLDDATRKFIHHPAHNRIENETLFVSEIFNWFSDDFNNDIPGFFLKYSCGDMKRQIQMNREQMKVKFLEYDWSLNGN